MGDPLSISASIGALLQISGTIVQYVRDTDGFADDRKQVLSEVTSVTGLLYCLKDLAEREQWEDSWTMTLFSLNVPDGPLEQLKRVLDRLATKLAPFHRLRKLEKALTWPFQKAEIKEILNTIEHYKSLCGLALQNDQLSGCDTAIKSDLSELHYDVVQGNKQSYQLYQDHTRRRIKEWLGAPNPSTNHNTAKQKQEPGTGTWFTNRADFVSWRSSSTKIVWVHGIPGCGKTILCSNIVENLLARCQTSNGFRLAYYYFDFNDGKKRTSNNLIRSLITQLSYLTETLPLSLTELFTRCQVGLQQPTISELISTLHGMLQDNVKTFIVLDALDECTDKDNLMKFLVEISGWNDVRLQLLCTSRKEREIEEAFEELELSQVPVQTSEISGDIDMYIRARLQKDPRLRKWPSNIQNEIRETLMVGAQGMFRWVACQIDTLRKCLKLDILRKALRSLPKTLEETYMRILLEIDEEYQQDAIKILQWIAFCARPLQLREVAEVVAIDSDFYFSHDRRLPEPLDLQIICSSLVIVTQAEVELLGVVERVDELRLAHFSVKEYLVSSRLESSPAKKFSILEMSAHSFIADSCLSYLLHVTDVSSLLEENLWEYPLARYAARYWTYHMLACGGTKRTYCQRDLSMELLAVERSRFNNWIRLWNPDEPHARSNLGMQSSEIASPIYYAALCGLHSLVGRLLDMKMDANGLGGLYGTPLQAAAVNGSLPTVQILLSGGAKTEIDAGHYGSPLSAASHKGHQHIVKLLLESGSDSESQDRSGRTALTWAAEGGSLDVVELLVDGGSNIEARDTRLRAPLIWAAESGHVHVVEFFISRGAQIEAKDHHSQAPLIWASKRGHEEIVRLFIERHADINSKDDRGHTALLWAAKRGYEAVVKLLVECGALIDEQDNNGQTALWWARKRKHQIVVDLLIQLGARSEEGWWGETVEAWRPFMIDDPAYVSLLAEVSTKSYAPLVRYLVEKSGNVEARGRKDQTVLLWAADEGEEEVVKWITEAEISVDIEAIDSSGQTALLCAAKRGYLTILAALISKGANPEARDLWWRQTPLSWAAKRGHLAIARLLLESGADVDAKNKDNQTALMWAVRCGFKELAILLIGHGADIEDRDSSGITALSSAIKEGRKDLSELLSIMISRL